MNSFCHFEYAIGMEMVCSVLFRSHYNDCLTVIIVVTEVGALAVESNRLCKFFHQQRNRKLSDTRL